MTYGNIPLIIRSFLRVACIPLLLAGCGLSSFQALDNTPEVIQQRQSGDLLYTFKQGDHGRGGFDRVRS